MNKLPPFRSWLYQQHSYMPTAGCPSSKAPVKDHWHWITCSSCEDGHKEQGRLFPAKLIGGQAPNLAWTETGCLLHFQIHPKLQQMWQLLRLFFLRHSTNTYWFPNRDGLTTPVILTIFLRVGKSTRPTHQYQKPWQVAPLQCQVPSGSPRSLAYLASTSYPMDPTQQITPWILLWGEWCCPHPPTLQLLLWAWIQW